jgi:hypothetical protein
MDRRVGEMLLQGALAAEGAVTVVTLEHEVCSWLLPKKLSQIVLNRDKQFEYAKHRFYFWERMSLKFTGINDSFILRSLVTG